MKRSTILISIIYLLFIGLNISLSIVLINKINTHNKKAMIENVENGLMLASNQFDLTEMEESPIVGYSKISFTENFDLIKEACIRELGKLASSNNERDEVKNYVPFNPVYNFLQ